MAQDPSAPNPTSRRQRTWIRDTLEVLLLALVLYGAIWSCFETVRVAGCSMAATLQNNDLLIASKVSLYFGNPQRGDIVIIKPGAAYCSAGDPECDFIKRVVGLPGDVVEIEDPNPQIGPAVMIEPGGSGNLEALSEPYIPTPEDMGSTSAVCNDGQGDVVNLPEAWSNSIDCCQANGEESTQPHAVRVPANEYFVMGDDRNHSEDSRVFGFINRKQIEAKAIFRLWPPFSFSLGAGSTLLPSLGFAAPLWWVGVGRRRHQRGRLSRLFRRLHR